MTDFQDYLLRDDFFGALKVARKASELCPGFYLAWVFRAAAASDVVLHANVKDDEVQAYVSEALESVDTAIRLKPNAFRAYLVKARILMDHGFYEDALKTLEEAERRLDNWYIGEVLARKSIVKFRLGMIDEALRDMEAYDLEIGLSGLAEKLSQEVSGDALVNAGISHGYAYMRLGDKAVEYAEKATDEKITGSTLVIRAFAYSVREKYELAVRDLAGLEACGALDEHSLLVLTWANLELERYQKAVTYADKALAVNPYNPHINMDRCRAIDKLHGEEMGTKCREKWVHMYLEKGMRNNMAAMDAVIVAIRYKNVGEYEKAEEYYKIAMKLAKYHYGEGYFSYADLLEELDRRKEAIKYYKLAVKYSARTDAIGPSAIGLERLGEDLEAIKAYILSLIETPDALTSSTLIRIVHEKSIKKLMKKLRKKGITCENIINELE